MCLRLRRGLDLWFGVERELGIKMSEWNAFLAVYITDADSI